MRDVGGRRDGREGVGHEASASGPDEGRKTTMRSGGAKRISTRAERNGTSRARLSAPRGTASERARLRRGTNLVPGEAVRAHARLEVPYHQAVVLGRRDELLHVRVECARGDRALVPAERALERRVLRVERLVRHRHATEANHRGRRRVVASVARARVRQLDSIF